MIQEQIISMSGTNIYTTGGRRVAIGNAGHKIGDWVWVDGGCVFGHMAPVQNLPYIPTADEGIIEVYFNNETGVNEYQLRSIKGNMPVITSNVLPSVAGKLVYGKNKFSFIDIIGGSANVTTFQNGQKVSNIISWGDSEYNNNFLKYFNAFYDDSDELCFNVFLENFESDTVTATAEYLYKELYYKNGVLVNTVDNSQDFSLQIQLEMETYKSFVDQDIFEKLGQYIESPALGLANYSKAVSGVNAGNKNYTRTENIRFMRSDFTVEILVNELTLIIGTSPSLSKLQISLMANVKSVSRYGWERAPSGAGPDYEKPWIPVAGYLPDNTIYWYIYGTTHDFISPDWYQCYQGHAEILINPTYLKTFIIGNSEVISESTAVRGNGHLSSLGAYNLGYTLNDNQIAYNLTWNLGFDGPFVPFYYNYNPIDYPLTEGFTIRKQRVHVSDSWGDDDAITLMKSDWSLDLTDLFETNLYADYLPCVTQKGDIIVLYNQLSRSLYKISENTKEITLIASKQINNYQFPVIKMSKSKFKNIFKATDA